MIDKKVIDRRIRKGFSYSEFLEISRLNIESKGQNFIDEKEEILFNLSRLNYQRSQRIQKTYLVSQKLEVLIKAINDPQIWMVLTGDWCDDSAQNLPYIAKMAGLNHQIEIRILLKDDNLDIMDMYLTKDKTRSIPTVVGFDTEGRELFIWGPRPRII